MKNLDAVNFAEARLGMRTQQSPLSSCATPGMKGHSQPERDQSTDHPTFRSMGFQNSVCVLVERIQKVEKVRHKSLRALLIYPAQTRWYT